MWHIKDSVGNSIIADLYNLLKEDNYLEIHTDIDFCKVYNDDKLQVGTGALLIEHKTDDGTLSATLINTNKIQSVWLRPYDRTGEKCC